MTDKKPTTSSLGRIVKIGGLMGRVGTSVATERAIDFAFSGPTKQLRRTENLVKNAARIVETLGEMKGAAMKVGQMLSLHESMLPPEVAEVLSLLQQKAPSVPSEVMRYEVEGALKAPITELFADFQEEAYASASIGQVHRATLQDGRPVAVKIQYPAIDHIVTADLKNLKRLFQSLFSMFFKADFEPLWEEVRDRLLEELDYEHEAENMRQMAELYAEVPEIVIPQVIDELSTRNVLTMEFVGGIKPREAISDRYPQELKNEWGRVLFEFQVRGLYQDRLMHADPNLANFAFLEDGRVVVYDFGCMKRIPEKIATGYTALVRALLDDRREDIPDLLLELGVFRTGPVAIAQEVIDPYYDLILEMMREDPPYVFGEDERFYEKIMDLGAANWSQSMDTHFPEDIIFIDRSFAGHFGNLTTLRAQGPWREIADKYTRSDPE
jgi:predicted unusual protein kinase regulating ubiquinone biosynthesis (AarF/ABC1/UbiB family)